MRLQIDELEVIIDEDMKEANGLKLKIKVR